MLHWHSLKLLVRALASSLLDCFLTIMALQKFSELGNFTSWFLLFIALLFCKEKFEDFPCIHLLRNFCFNPMKIFLLTLCAFLSLVIAVVTVLNFALMSGTTI